MRFARPTLTVRRCRSRSLTIFIPAAPVFLITGCCLRQKYREEKNVEGGTLDDFLCGGILHSLNLCQMPRELSNASTSGVERMER